MKKISSSRAKHGDPAPNYPLESRAESLGLDRHASLAMTEALEDCFKLEPITRRMKKADASALAVMMRKLAAFHGDRITPKARDFIAYGMGANKTAHIFLAFEEGKPVGFISSYIFANFKRGCLQYQVDLLFVEEKHRRSGVGAALIGAAMADAHKKGCKRLCVNAENGNKTANGFYVKMGFEKRKLTHMGYVAEVIPIAV